MSSTRFFEKLSEMIERLDTSRLSHLYSFRQELISQVRFLQESYFNGDFDMLADERGNVFPQPQPNRPYWNPDLIKIELFTNLIQAVSKTMDTLINVINNHEDELVRQNKRQRTELRTELALNTERLEPNEEEITYPICANFISELEAHSLRFNPVPQWPPRNLPSYDHRRVRSALIQTERYPPASVQQEVFSRAHPFIQRAENLDDPVFIEVQEQLSFRKKK